jgi:hypothetical protein
MVIAGVAAATRSPPWSAIANHEEIGVMEIRFAAQP